MIYEIKVPEAAFSITEATVVKWLKYVGEMVEAGEPIVTVETDKINVEVPAEGSGVLKEIFYSEGEVAPVGGVLGIIDSEADAAAVAAAAAEAGRPAPVSSGDSDVVAEKRKQAPVADSRTHKKREKRKISPTAKAVARAHGIDLSDIPSGSGPDGRIVKADVLQFIEKNKAAQLARPKPAKGKQIGEISEEKKVVFKGWRKVIADRMTSSVRNVPHYNNAIEVDVTDLSQIVSASREQKDQHRLTYLPFIMKAIKVGIDLIPEVNAYCYEDGFIIQDELNVGVAVDLGEKLLVPVVKDVKNKSILQLAEEIKALVTKARADELETQDISGGTITITNAGIYGIMYGTPIILQPQTTIISLGAVREVPSVINGSIAIRKKMIIVSSFDHRVVNGGPGARFLREVKTHLEDLNKLLLSMH